MKTILLYLCMSLISTFYLCSCDDSDEPTANSDTATVAESESPDTPGVDPPYTQELIGNTKGHVVAISGGGGRTVVIKIGADSTAVFRVLRLNIAGQLNKSCDFTLDTNTSVTRMLPANVSNFNPLTDVLQSDNVIVGKVINSAGTYKAQFMTSSDVMELNCSNCVEANTDNLFFFEVAPIYSPSDCQ